LFVGLRFFAVFCAFGYLHPDGFFQSPEVLAEDIFGFDTDRPWEFTSKHVDAPARTIVTPAITSGIPFLILKFLSTILGPRVINTLTLFYLPRFFLFLCSFLVDYTAYTLTGENRNALLVASSSWVMFAFMLAPFSNTVETLILCLLLLSVFKFKTSYSVTGAIIAVGVFNRFTFACYAVPIVVYLFYLVISDKPAIGRLISELSFGFFLTSFVIAVIDSIYFGSFVITIGGEAFKWSNLFDLYFWTSLLGKLGDISIRGSLVITPLNNLRYNLNPVNLALHGTHPRWLHVAINMPFLFGPLFFAFVAPWSNTLDEMVAARMLPPDKRPRKAVRKPVKGVPKLSKEVEYVLIACLVSAVGLHSISTHQEMRFMLPTFVLLVVLGCQELLGPGPNQKWYVWSWIAHCIIFGLVMGLGHQGGMVPAMASLQSMASTAPGTTHVIFFHTYMPPKHLLATSKGSPHGVQVYDMMGPDTSTLKDVRTKALRIAELPGFNSEKDEIYLIAPGTINVFEPTEGLTGWTLRSKHWFHFSAEDPPDWSPADLAKLSLNVYHKEK